MRKRIPRVLIIRAFTADRIFNNYQIHRTLEAKRGLDLLPSTPILYWPRISGTAGSYRMCSRKGSDDSVLGTRLERSGRMERQIIQLESACCCTYTEGPLDRRSSVRAAQKETIKKSWVISPIFRDNCGFFISQCGFGTYYKSII